MRGLQDAHQEFRRLSVVLDELPRIEPSGAFDAHVRQRIAEEPRASWFGWIVPAPRLRVFSGVLVGAFGMDCAIRAGIPEATTGAAQSEQDFRVIKDLDVLENYDVVKNFDALSELPVAQQTQTQPDQQQDKSHDGHI